MQGRAERHLRTGHSRTVFTQLSHFILTMNLLRLSALCPNDEEATRFLQARGVIHQDRVCSNGHPMQLSFGNQNRWRCRIRGSREERGLRTNIWLEGSRLSIRKIVLFMYAWSYEMTSIDFCQRELGIEASAVIDWKNYLREACAIYRSMHYSGGEITHKYQFNILVAGAFYKRSVFSTNLLHHVFFGS